MTIINHATNAAIDRNAHNNDRADWRAARHGTVISPHAPTTKAGAAQLTLYSTGGGSEPT